MVTYEVTVMWMLLVLVLMFVVVRVGGFQKVKCISSILNHCGLDMCDVTPLACTPLKQASYPLLPCAPSPPCCLDPLKPQPQPIPSPTCHIITPSPSSAPPPPPAPPPQLPNPSGSQPLHIRSGCLGPTCPGASRPGLRSPAHMGCSHTFHLIPAGPRRPLRKPPPAAAPHRHPHPQRSAPDAGRRGGGGARRSGQRRAGGAAADAVAY